LYLYFTASWKKLIWIALLLFSVNNLSAQKDYTFNSNGSACNFHYIFYSADNSLSKTKHPLLLILCKEGKTPLQTFEGDKLKNTPQFSGYYFIYVPNLGGDAKNKLECLSALANLLSFNFSGSRTNIFLQVNDSLISQPDIMASGLKYLFKSIRLGDIHADSVKINSSDNPTEIFKAAPEIESPKEEELSGTYYIDEDNKENETIVFEKSKKEYFGPPHSFNYTFTGVIHDKATGEALPFANVQIKGTSIGTSTNVDGYFTLLKVPSDTSVLVAQYVGYEKSEVFLTPFTLKRNFIIEMNRAVQTLKAVTVTGSREDVVLSGKTDIATIKITPKKLEQLPNIGEKDIMRSFQLMPGVSAANESSSGLYVLGGTPDQNLVLYDGFTVYHVDHLYGFFSAFNANALKDVQLYKGGFESRFGGRLSSVTEITGKDGNQKKFNMGADLSLLSMNAFVEIPIGSKFSSVVTFRKSYKGFIYNKIFAKFNKSTTSTSLGPQGNGPGGRQLQNSTITSYFYDLNGKFTYRPTDKDIVSLSIFNGTDKLDNSSSSQASSFGASNSDLSMSSTDLTKYGNIGSSLKWSRKWNEKLYGNTIISYSNYFSDRNRSQTRTMTNASGETITRSDGIFENNDLKDYSLKTDYQWDIFNFSQLQFGGFGTYFNINYSYAQNDTSSVLERKNKAVLAGGYLQSKMKLFNDKIQFLPGVRISYFEPTKKIYFEPRASLTLNLSDKFTLKGATGKYYQFANQVTREDIMSGSRDFWLLSDGNSVPVSSSIHYIVGLSYESNNYLFNTELYYKKLYNLTEYSLRFNPNPMGVSYDENFFNGLGYSRGIEFLAQKKSGKLNGWVSYTLGQAHNKFDIYTDSYYPANQDVTHEFKIVTLYEYKRWNFSATWIFATGRPYTAPSGAYSIVLLDDSKQDFFTVTAKNGLRLPDYHRCDIAVNFKLLAGSKGEKKRREIGSIGFSIFNLYNRTNVWYKQYTIEDGEILETNVNYLGITPNLSLSLKIR